MTMRPHTDILRGSLDLLILKTLSLQTTHGWGISQRIEQLSKGMLEVNQGSLYPALQRLEKVGLITSDWGTTDNNRKARYYSITAAGRRASHFPTPGRNPTAEFPFPTRSPSRTGGDRLARRLPIPPDKS